MTIKNYSCKEKKHTNIWTRTTSMLTDPSILFRIFIISRDLQLCTSDTPSMINFEKRIDIFSLF